MVRIVYHLRVLYNYQHHHCLFPSFPPSRPRYVLTERSP